MSVAEKEREREREKVKDFSVKELGRPTFIEELM